MRLMLWERLTSDLQNGGKPMSRGVDHMIFLFTQPQNMWQPFTSMLLSFKLKEDFESLLKWSTTHIILGQIV